MAHKSVMKTIGARKAIVLPALGALALAPALTLGGSAGAQDAAPADPTADSPSGEPMPEGDLPGWKQVFADDFTTDVEVGQFPGDAYSEKWDVYPDGWKDTSGNGTYMPSKVVSVANGVLNKHLHTEDGVHMVAALLPKLPGTDNGQTYGRYDVRFKADPVEGYKTAWLLWPDSEAWPDDGEIDFPEGDLDGTISAFMHYANPNGGQDEFSTEATYADWHTATIEWTEGKVVFSLDGEEIGTSTTDVPSNPMHQVIQTETSLDGSVPPDDAAGNVQIDWAVAYAPK